MQKPTIVKIVIQVKDTTKDVEYYQVIDTDGRRNDYWGLTNAQEFHQKELTKWEAYQNPQVLFDSETIKVIKFKDERQFNEWLRYPQYICCDINNYDLPVLFIKDAEGVWVAINNLTEQLATDMISAEQLIKKGD